MSTRYGACLALLCLFGLSACTEQDEKVLNQVGVVRILFVDTSVRTQYQLLSDETVDITAPDLPASGAQWKVTSATVTVDDQSVDPLFGGTECVFTALLVPFVSGPCANGFSVNAEEPVAVTVDIIVDGVQLLRARPADPPGCLPDEPDPDNPDATDGDCDNDGILDPYDICVWVPAPTPAPGEDPVEPDTHDYVFADVTDGIGDDCQQDTRAQDGSIVIHKSLPAFSAPVDGISYFVVDVSSDRVLSALTWGTTDTPGDFEVMGTAIEVCQANSLAAALAGCPAP